jgi:hypothetical protein
VEENMKVKRTCRDCGAVWRDEKGIFGDLRFGGIFFNVLYSQITRGSAIDIQYMNEQDRKKRISCPNCASNNVATQEITESPNEAQKKSKTKIETKESSFSWTRVFYISILGTAFFLLFLKIMFLLL